MFDPTTLLGFHTIVSLLALVTGLPLVAAMAGGRSWPRMASLTLLLLFLTSASGFLFPFDKVLPSHIVGALSLLALALAAWARWGAGLRDRWHGHYVAAVFTAVWLDAFVALVQAFLKVPALHAIAPTQQSPGFVLAQSLLLAVFVWLGLRAWRRLR